MGGAADALTLQIAFLREHLLTWLPSLAQQLAKSDHTGIYAAVATAMATYVAYDCDLLDALQQHAAPTVAGT